MCRISVLFLGISLPLSAASAGVAWDPPDAYDFAAVTALLEENLEAFSDNVVVLFERDGEPIYRYEHVFGVDTVEGIASATKLISAAVVLALRDDGVFLLDENVGQPQYVPLMSQQGKDFTIRQGFAMSSGLYSETAYARLPLYTLEQSVRLIALNADRVYDPGTAVWYDGSGMQTVGLVAERGTGLDWHTLAASYVLAPCEMTDTSYTQFTPNPAIAGGVRTSPSSYMNLLRTIVAGGVYNGTQVLSPQAVEELFRDQNGDNPILSSPFPAGVPWYPYGTEEPTYGFGAWVLAQHPVTGRIEEIISPGAWGTVPWIDRDRSVCGIIFTRVPPGSQSALLPSLQILNMVRNRIDDADRDVIGFNIPGESYYDPELLTGEDLMTFQDSERNIWLARLDPAYGLPADSTTAQDLLVTDSGAPLSLFRNGPEFAREQSGWSVFYNEDVDGVWRIWRAVPDGQGGLLRTMLTDDSADRGGMIVSDSPQLNTSYVAYVRGSAEDGAIYWIDRRSPEDEYYIGPFVPGRTLLRWVPDRPAFVVSLPDADGVYQLYWCDTATGEQVSITNGDVDITDPYVFRAAEYDNELMVLAIEDYDRLAVFAAAEPGGWQRRAVLTIPPESQYTILESPEAFTYHGRTYVTVQIESDEGTTLPPSEVWVFGIADNPYMRFTLRVDDGDDTAGLRRTDPEWYVGEDDVFVFYNVVSPAPIWEAYRSRTHMVEFALPRPGDLNNDDIVSASDLGLFGTAMGGPGVEEPPDGADPTLFGLADMDGDWDVDTCDFARLQRRVSIAK